MYLIKIKFKNLSGMTATEETARIPEASGGVAAGEAWAVGAMTVPIIGEVATIRTGEVAMDLEEVLRYDFDSICALLIFLVLTLLHC